MTDAHVEGAYHAVRGVKPAEGLQHGLVHGRSGFAMYRRARDAFTGEGETTGEEHRYRGAIMQPKYHRVLGNPVHLEKRSNRAEQIDHFEHQRHLKQMEIGE